MADFDETNDEELLIVLIAWIQQLYAAAKVVIAAVAADTIETSPHQPFGPIVRSIDPWDATEGLNDWAFTRMTRSTRDHVIKLAN
jgi:hypothetical protein